MTDFTTVIRKSVGRSPAAADPAARAEVYDHVYAVMLAQIERQHPPLSNAEIDDRIALFEASVREVEDEYAPPLAEAEPGDGDLDEPAEIPPGETLAYIADSDESVWDSPAIDMTWDAEHSAWRDAARERAGDADASADDGAIPGDWDSRIAAAVAGGRPAAPRFAAASDQPPPAPHLLLPPPEESRGPGLLARLGALLPRRPARSVARSAGSQDVPAEPAPKRVRGRKAPARKAAADAAAPAGSAPRARWGARRIGLVAVLVFVVLAGGYAASVFIPLLTGGGPDEAELVEAPDVELPTVARPAREVLPFVPDVPGPGAAVAPADLGIRSFAPLEAAAGPLAERESIILFNGENPTVFEASPDNPVRFRGEDGAGIARVGTSSTSAGVRAAIGPGIVQRLQGRSFRLMVEIRASPDNPASSIRFAYQHGRTLSDWQSATLGADFVTIPLDFAVPADGQTRGNDYLIIEPGIPGDGTAGDIRFIRVEVMPPTPG